MTPAQRQSESDASNASEEQRRIAERDKPFWEAAFLRVLGGIHAAQIHGLGADYAEHFAGIARGAADAALQARNTRWPATRHPTTEDDSDE